MNNQKGFAHLLLVIGIVSAMVVLGVFIMLGPSGTSGILDAFYNTKSQKKRSPLEQPDPVINIDDPNWETYRNDRYEFEVKHYPESSPAEVIGTETEGQFAYLLLIKFGTNPSIFPHDYEVRINNEQSLDSYRKELLGHITDKINSEEEVLINGNSWSKLNYQAFITTDVVPITQAIINHNGYDYVLTSSSHDIDQILSTFEFVEAKTGICIHDFETVTNAFELTFRQDHSLRCSENTTKSECEEVDVIGKALTDPSGPDGIPDCKWTTN